MGQSSRRGYLEIGGTPIKDAGLLAKLVASDTAEVSRLLSELEAAGIFSRDEHGVIFSRRIVKDTALSDAARTAGRRGGNPALLKRADNPSVKGVVKPMVKLRDQRPETRDQRSETKVQKSERSLSLSSSLEQIANAKTVPQLVCTPSNEFGKAILEV
jgi:hypothetical protein